MCGRFVLVDDLDTISKVFNVHPSEGLNYQPSYNISVGKKSLVITDAEPKILQNFQFGLTPFWSKKQMYLFNARSEGDQNQENDPAVISSGIIMKPAFRKPIRSQRCLIIASAFIEGTTVEGLSKPFLVHTSSRPFAMAGIWDTWINPESKEEVKSFSIITTTANELLQMIPHHRMPVILSEYNYHTWLKQDASLNEITALLLQYPAEKMNAYPISPDIKSAKNNTADLLAPLGPKLISESIPGRKNPPFRDRLHPK